MLPDSLLPWYVGAARKTRRILSSAIPILIIVAFMAIIIGAVVWCVVDFAHLRQGERDKAIVIVVCAWAFLTLLKINEKLGAILEELKRLNR
jgi:Na+/H+ antiporter NhaC